MGYSSSSARQAGRFNMVSRQSIFKYKTIKGPLHKVPAWIKLILLLPVSILCITLPPFWLLTGIIAIIITAFLCGFTLQEQLTDFKPALFYVIILYSFFVLTNFISLLTSHSSIFTLSSSWFSASFLIPNSDFLRTALRLILIVQLSALVFRTTSSLEIRDTVRLDIIAVFISFIPQIFQTWSNLNLAWKARAGKQGIGKIKTIVFVLISISFEKAAIKAKALEARRPTLSQE